IINSTHRHNQHPFNSTNLHNLFDTLDATAARILKGLDIKVVLSDGTLVGKLAPKIDQQLSRLSRRNNLRGWLCSRLHR
ncbi:hypothetical protein, partial [Mobiluncus mulieris]|uniref:hypothetical protein n=1 Tax=Mobiluncus mulieris TaxID=2052 RepID=UPI0021E2ACBF